MKKFIKGSIAFVMILLIAVLPMVPINAASNNSKKNAKTLQIGQTLSVTLDSVGDYWFKFNTDASKYGMFFLTVTNEKKSGEEIEVQLFSRETTYAYEYEYEIESQKFSNYENFQFIPKPNQVCYVRLNPGTKVDVTDKVTFELKATERYKIPEENNIPSVSYGKKVSGTITTEEQGYTYKIKSPNYTCYMTLKASVEDGYCYVFLEDDNGVAVLPFASFVDKGVDEVFAAKLEPNRTYYIQVTTSTDRTAKFSFEANVYKDIADVKSAAVGVDYNKNIKGAIASGEDADWYKFYVPQKQFVFLGLSKPIDYGTGICAEIWNDAGKQMMYSKASYGETISQKALLDPGMYYVKVKSTKRNNCALSNYSFELDYGIVGEGLKYNDKDGKWYYTKDGEVDKTKTGLVYDTVVGWWYVKDGCIDFSCNDLIFDSALGWWKITGGTIDFGYNDLFFSPGLQSWWKITNGTVDFGYNDLFFSPGLQSWWKITGGTIDFGYNDLFFSPGLQSWWKITGGMVDLGYSGLYFSPGLNSWWNIQGGALVF